MSNKLIRKIIIIVCIAAVIIIPGIFQLNLYFNKQSVETKNVIFGIVFTLVVTILICMVNFLIFNAFRKHYNNHRAYLKMMILEGVVTTLAAALVMAFTVFLCYLFFGNYPEDNTTIAAIYFNNIVVAMIVNLIVVGFIEAYTLFTRWKKAAIESERLLREKADARYSALKNQVNPHFLFNSLNSLSSLIRKSPDKAVEFVDKFSKIYRYVLDSSDIMLIELREELNFIQSFIFLQKIRFNDNLVVNIKVDAAYMNTYIPPLSVQLLLENAIKHNEISTEYPLLIDIFVEDSYLIMKNNIRLKITLEKSTGIGLKNLEERYKHFTERATSFTAVNNEFIAKLPLLSENEL